MQWPELDDLDARETLAAASCSVRVRRQAEVEEMLVLAHWAYLHGDDPRETTGRAPRPGEDHLRRLGGEGTPAVRDHALGEIALAREAGDVATANLIGDVLDLRHRLPLTWQRVTDLECEPWVARRVAAMSRHLSPAAVAGVDRSAARMIHTHRPWEVVRVIEARVAEADPEAHEEKVRLAAARKYVTLSRVDEAGLRTVVARVTAGDAAWVDATVERAADLLREQYPDTCRDTRRSIAFGFLARPAELLELLLRGNEAASASEETPPEPPDDEPVEPTRALALRADLLDALRSVDPARLRPRAVVYVHLSQRVLDGSVGGVARVEDIGPMLGFQVRQLLRHAHVDVKPVLDLADTIRADAYEHPEELKDRVRLTSGADCFPFGGGDGPRGVDHDHVVPWLRAGPPGQTGTHNCAPLGRRHHRWKTHAGYRVLQVRPGAYLWRTPHGRHYLVDHLGTRELDPDSLGRDTFTLTS